MTKEILRKLYPTLTDEELERSRENFKKYVGLVLEIYEDLQRKREENFELGVFRDTIQGKVDQTTNHRIH